MGDGMRRAVFDSGLPDRIREDVAAAERRARRRRLDPGHLEEILEAVRRHPAGCAWADGGAVPLRYRWGAETTRLDVWWFTRLREKHVAWEAGREDVSRVPWGRGPQRKITAGPEGRRFALQILFPDRYERLRHLKCLRKIRPLGVALPPGSIYHIAADGRFRLAVAHVYVREGAQKVTRSYLCTPAGCFHLRILYRDASKAAEEVIGEPLPSRRGAGWEDVEPLFVLAALR